MYLLALITMVVQAAHMGSRVIATLLALDLGASKLAIGALIASYSVIPLLLALHSGRVADRYGTRAPMLWGSAAIGVGLLTPFLFPHSLAALFVMANLIGLGFVFFNVAAQTLAGRYGPREERARNFATLSLGYSASNLVGPVSAGYAIQWYGHAGASMLMALAMLFPLAALLLARRLAHPGTEAGRAGGGSSLDLLANAPLRKVIVASALIVTGWDLFTFYVPIYGHGIGLSPPEIGIILGAFAIGGLVMRALLPLLTKRFRIRPVLVAAMVCGAALYVAFPFVADYHALIALSFLIGCALGCGQPLTLTLAFNRSPPGRGGEVTGLRLAINNVTHVVVPLSAGALGAALGMAPVFVLAASFLLIGGLMGRRD